MDFRIGTAGWTVPRQHLDLFPPPKADTTPSHLERYASGLRCVEINSTFYRSHRANTWKKWADATPDDFRFALKAPKAITHQARLINTGALLQEFFAGITALGEKLGPILFQLPPKLTYDEGVAHEFLTTLREVHPGPVALEPRNATWFTGASDRMLRGFEVARVAADPPKGSEIAGTPAGWPGLRYWRLHGSPRTYYSDYDTSWQHTFLHQLASFADDPEPSEHWIIFDNTALGHATANALRLAKKA